MHTVGKNTEVLIVGAGPTGLMMACQLAIHKVPFRIIDKKESAISCSGALIVQARSLEILNQMGIVEKAINEGIIASQIRIIFNGRSPLFLRLKDMGSDLSQFPYVLMLEQSILESQLTDFIRSYGYVVERKIEWIDFGQDISGVTSLVKHPDGKEEIIKTDYLIAADGGTSAIRKQLNIPFLGKTHELSLFVTDCKAEVNLGPDEICFSFSKNATSGLFPLKEGRWRIDGALSKSAENSTLSFTDIEKDFAQRNLLNISLHDPEWFSVFHSHQRYALSFQQNRCFLLGDAAHIFSPVGAQGMNTGIQDAYNLAWKIAFVARGKAKSSLLDTYSEERQVIVKKLIDTTDHAFKLVTNEQYWDKIFRLYLAPAILKVLFFVIEKQETVRHFFFKGIAQIGIHYRKNYNLKISSNGKFRRRAPKPGDRLPYITFKKNDNIVNVQEQVSGTNFHLFAFVNNDTYEDLTSIAKEYSTQLTLEIITYKLETKHLFERFGITGNGFVLIRPDMHIAYRSNKFELEHLKNYLSQVLINSGQLSGYNAQSTDISNIQRTKSTLRFPMSKKQTLQ